MRAAEGLIRAAAIMYGYIFTSHGASKSYFTVRTNDYFSGRHFHASAYC